MPFTPLSRHSNHEFEEGTFDVRGWEVRTQIDDEKVGKVDDVLIDQEGNAPYLDVDLGIFKKHVLLPIGQARVDEREDVVWVPGMEKNHFKDIPEYEHDKSTVDREYENRLTAAYGGAYTGSQYYSRPEYESGYAASGGGREASARSTGGGAGTSAEGAEELKRLDKMDDFDVADHEPDPRGWRVIGGDGSEIGKVDHLIADTGRMKVRYLDVDVDSDLVGEKRDVLVPAGYARLEESDKTVRIDALNSNNAADLPAYTGKIDRDYENRLHERLSSGYTDESRYRHPRYDARRFYEPRRTSRSATGDRLAQDRSAGREGGTSSRETPPETMR